MKQNVSETESNWRFLQKCKNMSAKQEMYLMSHSRHDHFHPILILPVNLIKLLQQHTNIVPLVVGPTVTNGCKELHLKYSRIP